MFICNIIFFCQAEEKEVFCRNAVQPDQNAAIGFVPNALPEAVAAETNIKRASMGAVFLNKMDQLPTVASQIVWEVALALEPPAKVRPVKPKMYLMGKLDLMPGIYYLLK
jgi:hypothetical protein